MPRTTSVAVEAIIEVDEEIPLTPFIETASALVEEICTPAGYDAARLELIERWLSAHFYAVRESRRDFEGAGTVQQSLQSKVDLGFDVTHYGQMAMRLDTKGGLARLNEMIKSGKGHMPAAWWLGVPRDEEGSNL
jgi:hypothetical protein